MKTLLYILVLIQAIGNIWLVGMIKDHSTWLGQLSTNSNYYDSAIQVLLKETEVEICFFEDHSIGKCYPDTPTN